MQGFPHGGIIVNYENTFRHTVYSYCASHLVAIGPPLAETLRSGSTPGPGH
jgi:hypothetical protein